MSKLTDKWYFWNWIKNSNKGSSSDYNVKTNKVFVAEGSYTLLANIIEIAENSIDTSNLTDVTGLFERCYRLTKIPVIDVSNATNLNYFANRCKGLIDVPVLNLSSATSMNSMFFNCTSLSDNSLNNIMASLISATSYSGTKTLSQIGLTTEQINKCKTLSNYQNFINAGWVAG